MSKVRAKKKAAAKTAAANTAETIIEVGKVQEAVKSMPAVEVCFQFSGKEYTQEDIIHKVKEAWEGEIQGQDLKSLKIYAKPEERAAYYVVNEDFTGKVEL